MSDSTQAWFEQAARAFHEEYERLALSFGYATRPESAVPWEEVPEPNRSLMIATAAVLERLFPRRTVTWNKEELRSEVRSVASPDSPAEPS